MIGLKISTGYIKKRVWWHGSREYPFLTKFQVVRNFLVRLQCTGHPMKNLFSYCFLCLFTRCKPLTKRNEFKGKTPESSALSKSHNHEWNVAAYFNFTLEQIHTHTRFLYSDRLSELNTSLVYRHHFFGFGYFAAIDCYAKGNEWHSN